MPLTPFADGPGNNASGVAVYNNDLYLDGRITTANTDREYAFSTWKTILFGSGTATPSVVTGGGTYFLYPSAGNASVVTTSGLSVYAFYLDPADYTANTRTTKYRLRVQTTVNAVSVGVNLVPGLYPVSSFGGVSGGSPTIVTVGTVVSGSTVVFTTPGASSNTVLTSTEFTAPAAGAYVFMVNAGGAMNANSAASMNLQLQMRQV